MYIFRGRGKNVGFIWLDRSHDFTEWPTFPPYLRFFLPWSPNATTPCHAPSKYTAEFLLSFCANVPLSRVSASIFVSHIAPSLSSTRLLAIKKWSNEMGYRITLGKYRKVLIELFSLRLRELLLFGDEKRWVCKIMNINEEKLKVKNSRLN